MQRGLLNLFKILKKWNRLSWEDQRLFLKVLALTGMIRAVIVLLPFKWISPYLGDLGRESFYEVEAGKLDMAMRIGMAIRVVSNHTPWESKCLVQAVTGKLMLRQRGISSTLYLGVRKDEKGMLMAHSWLRVGSSIITGQTGMEEEDYTVLSCFSEYSK